MITFFLCVVILLQSVDATVEYNQCIFVCEIFINDGLKNYTTLAWRQTPQVLQYNPVILSGAVLFYDTVIMVESVSNQMVHMKHKQ